MVDMKLKYINHTILLKMVDMKLKYINHTKFNNFVKIVQNIDKIAHFFENGGYEIKT